MDTARRPRRKHKTNYVRRNWYRDYILEHIPEKVEGEFYSLSGRTMTEYKGDPRISEAGFHTRLAKPELYCAIDREGHIDPAPGVRCFTGEFVDTCVEHMRDPEVINFDSILMLSNINRPPFLEFIDICRLAANLQRKRKKSRPVHCFAKFALSFGGKLVGAEDDLVKLCQWIKSAIEAGPYKVEWFHRKNSPDTALLTCQTNITSYTLMIGFGFRIIQV